MPSKNHCTVRLLYPQLLVFLAKHSTQYTHMNPVFAVPHLSQDLTTPLGIPAVYKAPGPWMAKEFVKGDPGGYFKVVATRV